MNFSFIYVELMANQQVLFLIYQGHEVHIVAQ
jgi:hypothetical protein